MEALQYFQFLHEYNDVNEWMRDQTSKADVEEYGADLEHVELLIQAFDTFHASILNSEPRIQQCVENGHVIIDAKSSYRYGDIFIYCCSSISNSYNLRS